MKTIRDFRELELGRLCSGPARIKIATSTAVTKYIIVTSVELEKIKEVLLCED